MERIRQIIYYKDYYLDFYNKQNEKVKDKFDYVLFLISVAERIPKKFFDHITETDGLYEIRIEYNSNIYRVFSCFDEGNLVILFNGFQKKTQKTPLSEIEKALGLKYEYFQEKLKLKRDENKNKKK